MSHKMWYDFLEEMVECNSQTDGYEMRYYDQTACPKKSYILLVIWLDWLINMQCYSLSVFHRPSY